MPSWYDDSVSLGERVKLDQTNYSGRWDLGSKPARESLKRTVDVYEFDPNLPLRNPHIGVTVKLLNLGFPVAG